MRFQGCVILAAGQEIGIVIVEPHVLDSQTEYDEIRVAAQRAFGPGVRGYRDIVLMVRNEDGVPTYSGTHEPVNFLADLEFDHLPWQQYEV